MINRSLLLALLLTGCGGSGKFLEKGGEEVPVVKGGSVQRTFTFETTGSYTGKFTFATTTDTPDVTSALSVSSADTSKTNGKQEVVVTATVSPTTTETRAFVNITATKDGETRHTALSSFFLTIE